MPASNSSSSPARPQDKPLYLPRGFRYSGVAAGIKKSGKPDVALVVMDEDAVVAGVYTTNQVVAAPVLVCRGRTPQAGGRAIVVNSGNANACTGDVGLQDAHDMARQVASRFECDEAQVLVMSTGVIGHPLPMDRVTTGIDAAFGQLGEDAESFLAAADAICTTDQFRKVASRTVNIGGRDIRIAAMAKGAGMIAPNMATLLGMILTDAPIEADAAQRCLGQIVQKSFNCVSVDGHTSTNDTLLLAATGKADATSASQSPLDAEQLEVFCDAATEVALELAKLLVADGEGAARFFEIRVSGAASESDARTIAKTVGDSPLVKTAVAGADPNWGRIVSAAGYAGPAIDASKTSLRIQGETVFEAGQPTRYDAATLSELMKKSPEVILELNVGNGRGTASRWASDLTEAYVRFNSLYTT